jgi:sortase A
VATAAADSPTAVVQPAASVGVEPARLVIPDLKIDTKVVPMGWQVVKTASGERSDWVIPKNEAGHHIDSAQLGVAGNLVISGHNNIYGRVFMPISLAWDDDTRVKVDAFTDRSDILNGRRIALYDAVGQEYDYVITEFYRLKDTGVSVAQREVNARFIQPTDDTRLTIVTCWPPTNNTHRLIVVAVPAQ